jgi:hypothetical protein
MEMTTTLWIVFAIAVLELGGFAFLWLLWLFHERAGARHEPAHEPASARHEAAHESAGAQTASPSAG